MCALSVPVLSLPARRPPGLKAAYGDIKTEVGPPERTRQTVLEGLNDVLGERPL